IEIDNLKPGLTYYVAVTAYNAAGESDFSDENSITIPNDANLTQSMQSDDGGSGGGGGGCFIAVAGL
ncbi:MAG TPA: fibronectin type III domain-containing protein, partial [Deltaproteobacteria bacterium]|nr:fibronectin type III domain-containing protein [Deltaproteobacteria bacterium]